MNSSLFSKLENAIDDQVPLARAAALIVLTVGISILVMISSAPYAAFIEGSVEAIPGTDIEVPLPILLVVGPLVVVALQCLALQQYKGLADSCALLRDGTAEGGQDYLRARLPNDPLVQWQTAPGQHGRLACLVTLTSLLLLPFLLIAGMGLSALPFQDDALIITHLVVSLISLLNAAAWCWFVRRNRKKRSRPGLLAMIVLVVMTAVLLVQACVARPMFSWQSAELAKGEKKEKEKAGVLACLPLEAGNGCDDAWVRSTAKVPEDGEAFLWAYTPASETWLCRWTGLGCRAPNLSHKKLGDTWISRDRNGEMLEGVRIKLHQRSLRYAELSAASLLGGDLTCADLSGARLFGADLSHAVLQRTVLTGAGLTSANFRHAYLRQLDLRAFDLRGGNFQRALLHDVSLAQSNLQGANFMRATIVGTEHGKAGAMMICNNHAAEFLIKGADLRLADLRHAKLVAATLVKVQLGKANLASADLRGSHLAKADLTGASLVGANLTGADLRGAKLENADLREAILTGADLRGASLIGAIGLGDKQERLALTDHSASLKMEAVAKAFRCSGKSPDDKVPTVWQTDEMLHRWLSDRIADCIEGNGEPELRI